MPENSWTIRFNTSDGHPYTVTSPGEALEALLSIFPEKYGTRYDSAVSACRAALEGVGSGADARREFLASLKENGLEVIAS